LNFSTDFLKGTIIGIGAVAPGVSGGAFAVMLGVYSKLTSALANIFHDFFRKVKTLFPLGMGIVFGVLAFSRVMKYLFEYHETNIRFLFIGLMLGTIPSVIKDANKNGFKKSYLIPCLIAFSITVIFTILENNVIDIIPETSPDLLTLIVYGVVIGFGTIIPGVSSSLILMYIGAYETLLDALVSLDLMVIIPVGIGFGFSILLFAKLINYLFDKAYGFIYYIILGFVFGSIIAILPNVELGLEIFSGIIYLVIGFLLTYFMSAKYSSNEKKRA